MPYAYSWYLDEMAHKWDVLVMGDYEAVCPLPWNAKWLGLKQVYQPFFCQQLGVFGKNTDTALIGKFLEAIPPPFRKIHLCLNEKNAVGDLPGWNVSKRPNFLLDLNRPFEKIETGFSKSLRKRLRKAREQHQLLDAPLLPRELSGLYQKQVGDKVECPPATYQRFERVMTQAIERDLGKIWGAQTQDGELTAAGFFLHSHGRLINVFGASTEKGKELHSMHFLLDALIQKHAGQEWVLDFEGSSIPSIAYFFGSFGAEEVGYACVTRDKMPWGLRKIRRMMPA